MTTLCVLWLCVAALLARGARARRMSDKSWSALQELVDDAYSFGRPTSRVERLWDWDRLPADCNSFSFDPDSFGGNGIVCGSFGDITDLAIRDTKGGQLDSSFFLRAGLTGLTRLTRLHLSGFNIRGFLPSSKSYLFRSFNFQHLSLIGTSVRGPLPPWLFEGIVFGNDTEPAMLTVEFRNNEFLDRQLPLDLPGDILPQTCSLAEDAFFDCPIPEWVGHCVNNRTLCNTPTPAPTPAPTPPTEAPTPSPTPAPTPAFGYGDLDWATLIPCPPNVNRSDTEALEAIHVPSCAIDGVTCQYPCILHECSASYGTSAPLELARDDRSWNCFKVLGPDDCGPSTFDCSDAWAPPDAGLHYLDVEFGTKVYATELAVFQNLDPGSVTSIEAFSDEMAQFVLAWQGVEPNRTRESTRRVSLFDFTSVQHTNRIRVNVTAAGWEDEIDSLVLVGNETLLEATLAPTPAPTPVPTPVPCLPVVQLTPMSTLDSSVGDERCIVPQACQWACRVNACSGSYNTDTYRCENVLHYNRDTVWNQPAEGNDEFLDLEYDVGMVPSAVLVIEEDVGGGVTGIELFDPELDPPAFVSAYSGAFRTMANDGVEVYELDRSNLVRPNSTYINRVRLLINGYRLHNIAAVRLVGRPDPSRVTVVPTPHPPRPPPRRLPGVFVKTQSRITQEAGRYGMLAQNNPAPVLDDVLYVPPGWSEHQSRSFQFEYDMTMDRCNLTTMVCSRHNGSPWPFDPVNLDLVSSAALHLGSKRMWLMAGGRGRGYGQFGGNPQGNIYYRSDDDPTWNELVPDTPRYETCMAAAPGESRAFIAGGLTIDSFNQGTYRMYNTIEQIDFPSGFPDSARSAPIAARLSRARAELGCAVAGATKRFIMFVGGRFPFRGGQEPSDDVDLLNLDTLTIETSKLSKRVVAPSVASVASLVFVTGGSPTFGPPTNGEIEQQFDYGAWENLAVERYDMDAGEWQYFPGVLSELVYETYSPDRIAVPFADRFIAVVAGQATYNHSGSQDPMLKGQDQFRRPIDIYDSATNSWHNDLLQQHASTGYMAAGVGNKLAIVGGRHSPDSYYETYDELTVFEWQPYPYTLIDCAQSSDCTSCLSEDTLRHYVECRWCYDPSSQLDGRCIESTQFCSVAPYTETLVKDETCPTAAPTPEPRLTFSRRFVLRVLASFDDFDFDAFKATLAAFLGVQPDTLSEFAPPRNGSVIVHVQQRIESVRQSEIAALDAQWLNVTEAPGLNVASVEPVADDFQVTDAPTPSPTPAPAPSVETPEAPAPGSDDRTMSGTMRTAASGAAGSNTQVNVVGDGTRSGAPVADDDDDDNTMTIVIALVAVLAVCLVLAVIAFIVMKTKSAAKQSAAEQELLDSQGTPVPALEGGYESRGTMNTLLSDASSRAPQTVSGVGEVDSKYIILSRDIERGKKLGEGAFGIVYKGRWRNIDVAVKEVKYEAMHDPTQIESFQQEAVKMSQLRPHANCVTLFGIVTNPLAIVTQFCEHGSLDDWLRSDAGRAASTPQLLRIVSGAARGVAHLHAEGIVHRDLAARNILLAEGMTPKVADFGMSRVNAGEDQNQTRTKVGPLKWMAPEQLLEQSYSRRSDVFSFGVVIYEVMSGREPWEDIANTAACYKVLNGERLPVPARAPDALGDLMRLCFETEPEARPSMDDACRRLDNILADQGVDESTSGVAASAPAATTHVKKEARKSRRKSRKSRQLMNQSAASGYDVPDTSSAAGTDYGAAPPPATPSAGTLAASDAYSLAPEPSARGDSAYEQAPTLDTTADGNASDNKIPADSAYSEPDVSGASQTMSTAGELARNEQVAPNVAKLSQKEQAKLWRLSKKYEPKSPPATESSTDKPQPIKVADDSLPESWSSAISPLSGRTYYYSKKLGKTQWTRPTTADG